MMRYLYIQTGNLEEAAAADEVLDARFVEHNPLCSTFIYNSGRFDVEDRSDPSGIILVEGGMLVPDYMVEVQEVDEDGVDEDGVRHDLLG